MVPHRRGLSVSSQSTKMNAHLKFSCVNGNALIGAAEITCLPSGNWSSPFPVCESESISKKLCFIYILNILDCLDFIDFRLYTYMY